MMSKCIAALMLTLLLILAGCSSVQDNTKKAVDSSVEKEPHIPTKSTATQDKIDDPTELVEEYVIAVYADDDETVYACWGVVNDPVVAVPEGQYDFNSSNKVTVTVKNIQFERFTGEEFNETLEDITTYWLNSDSFDMYEFSYTAFDIRQIGYASCTVTATQTNEETEIEEICVVETDKGWFIALDGY